MQYASSSTIRCSPRTWPSMRRSRRPTCCFFSLYPATCCHDLSGPHPSLAHLTPPGYRKAQIRRSGRAWLARGWPRAGMLDERWGNPGVPSGTIGNTACREKGNDVQEPPTPPSTVAPRRRRIRHRAGAHVDRRRARRHECAGDDRRHDVTTACNSSTARVPDRARERGGDDLVPGHRHRARQARGAGRVRPAVLRHRPREPRQLPRDDVGPGAVQLDEPGLPDLPRTSAARSTARASTTRSCRRTPAACTRPRSRRLPTSSPRRRGTGAATWRTWATRRRARRRRAGSPRSAGVAVDPAVGALDDTEGATAADQYAARHNPFVYFHSLIDPPAGGGRRVCAAHVVPALAASRPTSRRQRPASTRSSRRTSATTATTTVQGPGRRRREPGRRRARRAPTRSSPRSCR